ncbi:hypothetical protein BPAE_0135g00280 [Botrytis paeoniae]|uniref:Ankyrin n=1 Tax=Botrytis paeoniae TaxID=278948 RepID=A0A4Z1FJ39_9HELO|nr:hypothetical protein BPAE_0135g00280 [Botrytis paeoniae]
MANKLNEDILSAAKSGDFTPIFSSIPSPELLRELGYLTGRHSNPTALERLFTLGLTIPPESENNPIFHGALESESIPIFQVLLNNGFNLNNHWSESLGDGIVVAAMRGNIPLAAFLLGNGQDPNNGSSSGDREAIIWAMVGDFPSLEFIKLMLRYGFKTQGTGAAIAAAELGNLEALKLFVETDRDLDLEEKVIWHAVGDRESFGSEGTALYRACRAGKMGTVEYLLGKGVDATSTDRMGRSCMDVAKAGGYEDVVELLRKHLEE